MRPLLILLTLPLLLGVAGSLVRLIIDRPLLGVGVGLLAAAIVIWVCRLRKLRRDSAGRHEETLAMAVAQQSAARSSTPVLQPRAVQPAVSDLTQVKLAYQDPAGFDLLIAGATLDHVWGARVGLGHDGIYLGNCWRSDDGVLNGPITAIKVPYANVRGLTINTVDWKSEPRLAEVVGGVRRDSSQEVMLTALVNGEQTQLCPVMLDDATSRDIADTIASRFRAPDPAAQEGTSPLEELLRLIASSEYDAQRFVRRFKQLSGQPGSATTLLLAAAAPDAAMELETSDRDACLQRMARMFALRKVELRFDGMDGTDVDTLLAMAGAYARQVGCKMFWAGDLKAGKQIAFMAPLEHEARVRKLCELGGIWLPSADAPARSVALHGAGASAPAVPVQIVASPAVATAASGHDGVNVGRNIYPIVRRRDDPKYLQMQEQHGPIFEMPFVDNLVCTFSIDMGEHYQVVREAFMREHGLPAEELRSAALRNLKARFLRRDVIETVNVAEVFPGAPAATVHRIDLDADLNASLLLVEDLWDGMIPNIIRAGSIMAAIPRKSSWLWFADLADVQARLAMRMIAEVGFEDASEESKHLSGRVLVRAHGVWGLMVTDEPTLRQLHAMDAQPATQTLH